MIPPALMALVLPPSLAMILPRYPSFTIDWPNCHGPGRAGLQGDSGSGRQHDRD